MEFKLINALTRQIHADAKKRRCALLFGSGDLQRYMLRRIR